MAGKTDVFENDFLKLLFQGTAIANIADNAASAPLTNNTRTKGVVSFTKLMR